MQGFQDITLSWRGAEYTLRARGIMPVVASVEDAIRGDSPRQAIQILLQPGGPSYPRIAMAFGTALRAAGCSVTDEEIHLSIVDGFANGDVDAAATVQHAIIVILSIISPPMAMALAGGDKGVDDTGEDNAAGS